MPLHQHFRNMLQFQPLIAAGMEEAASKWPCQQLPKQQKGKQRGQSFIQQSKSLPRPFPDPISKLHSQGFGKIFDIAARHPKILIDCHICSDFAEPGMLLRKRYHMLKYLSFDQTVQFSTFNPGTSTKSDSLFVTTVALMLNAWAASNRSKRARLKGISA